MVPVSGVLDGAKFREQWRVSYSGLEQMFAKERLEELKNLTYPLSMTLCQRRFSGGAF